MYAEQCRRPIYLPVVYTSVALTAAAAIRSTEERTNERQARRIEEVIFAIIGVERARPNTLLAPLRAANQGAQ